MNQSRQQAEGKVIIVGGGPAGTVAAAALARAGRPVLLLEKETFPRFHIGESLLPASLPIFQEIGIGDYFDAQNYPDKRGASFIVEDGSAHFRIRFADALGEEDGRAWHVPRAEFDLALLRHAADCGVEVVESARAVDAELDDDDGVSVTWVDPDGNTQVTEAAELIDASGQRGFLAKLKGVRRPNPALRKVSVYAHVDQKIEVENAVEGDVVVISRHDLGWIWVIPLPNNQTSIGAVYDRERHPSGANPLDILREYVRTTPILHEQIPEWEPIASARIESDFSYSATEYTGPHWIMAGDAAAFVDPVFSSGVHLAVESGYEAARTIIEGTPSARNRYERLTRRRIRRFQSFVEGFYDRAFRDVLFTPDGAPTISAAITGLLSGVAPSGISTRLKIGTFHAVTKLQRYLPLVPKVHRIPTEQGEPVDA